MRLSGRERFGMEAFQLLLCYWVRRQRTALSRVWGVPWRSVLGYRCVQGGGGCGGMVINETEFKTEGDRGRVVVWVISESFHIQSTRILISEEQ